MKVGCDLGTTGSHTTTAGPPHGSPQPAGNGSFTWDIPWEYSVAGSTPKKYATARVLATAAESGTATMSKGGSATVSCERDDAATPPRMCLGAK
jgi:hypothetical protein